MPDSPAHIPQNQTLLIYAPVPVYRTDGAIFVEDQAINGLRLWSQHFDEVIVMFPEAPGPPPQGWSPVTPGAAPLERVRIETLPMAYRPDQFLRHLGPTRRRIKELIGEAHYVSFAIGGLFGDWGAVGCLVAHAQHRPYGVWTDRVESEVTRRMSESGSLKSRLRARLYHRPMAMLERHVISKAHLGMFHGKETYDAYAPWCVNPHVVHDIHIAVSDHISEAQLARKVASAAEGPLRIVYAGRADPMKGPLDWVSILIGLHARDVDFRATWLGDGSEFEAMQTRIAEAGLSDRITMPGFVTDRAQVLDAYREAHVFLFCHKTPESPRAPIEALISGTVLVGYDGAFVRDLTERRQSGLFRPIGDLEGVTEDLALLAQDRAGLAKRMEDACCDGAPFDDVSVFKHRCDLIKTHLP